jgi:hypothetical protein
LRSLNPLCRHSRLRHDFDDRFVVRVTQVRAWHNQLST